MNNEFIEKAELKNSYCEVLEILKYISIYDYIKIPKRIIEKFNKNANKDYQFKYDPSKTLDEQHVSKLTKKIILLLYRDYWATDKQKEEFNEIVKNTSLNNNINQIEDNKNLLSDNKTKTKVFTENKSLTVYKKYSIFRKIFDKLKRIFL